jgi:hypothetical protein
MSKKGAELTASGMYTRHLLEKVKATGKDSLSKLLIWFFAAVVVTAIISGDCAQVGRMLAKANAKQCLVPGLNANNVSSLSKSDFTTGDGGIPCPQNS